MIFSIIVPIYNVEKYLRCCVTNRSKNAGGGGFSLIYNNLQTKRLI